MPTLTKTCLYMLCTALLLLNACKPEPSEQKWNTYGPYYMGDLANYVCFKPGTIWIYKNPATGERDTVRCAYGKRYMDTVVSTGYHVKVVKETFYTAFSFSRDGFDGDISDFRYTYWQKPEPFDYKINFGKAKQGSGGGDIVAMFYPFDKTRNPKDVEPGYSFIAILMSKDTSVNIYGRYFDTVQIFKNTSDITWNSFPAIYYWAKGFGIVYRRDMNTGEEWFLESEYIIQ
jgi:hypothetical protein